jgi:DNA-binding transcriptional LysR family regulator
MSYEHKLDNMLYCDNNYSIKEYIMDRLQSLLIFIRIIENTSFSATAREMHLTQSSISKHLDALESQLKTKLITRTTRQLHLTEEGEKFYRQAKSILEQYDYAIGEVKNSKANPSGTIRLATSVFFGRRYVTPLLAKFLNLYPEISLEHRLNDRIVDLIEEGIDLSIRIGEQKDSTYMARRIGLAKRVTVAAPELLQTYGLPKHPRELANYPCIIFSGLKNPHSWNYVGKKEGEFVVSVKGRYQTDVSEAMREALCAGIGIFPAPAWLIGRELQSGQLQQILQEFEPMASPIYAVTPPSAYVPQKVKLLTDFLANEFRLNTWVSDY